jgi:branched-chain amino acid transport system substrate-binding protein
MTQASIAGAFRRRRKLLSLGAATAAALLVVSACGGSSDDGGATATSDPTSTSETSPAEPVTGEPIKTMTITDINSPGAVYPNIHITADAAQTWINENGGVAGRPLEVIKCDSQGTADGAANCAREAVSAGVVAVVGNFNFSPDAMVEVLEAAEIPYFGNCCALGAKENTSDWSFPLGSIQMYGVGEVKKAVEDGCQKIKAMIIEGAESFWPPMQEAAARLGAADRLDPNYVTQPGTVQDQSAQVAELLAGGTDCVVSVTSETPLTAFMVAWGAAQPTAKFYGSQGNLNKVSAAGNEEILEGSVVVGVYPDLACPVWDPYRATLEAIGADPSQDYNSLGGLGTWTAYMAFKQVAERIDGEITAKSFQEQASVGVIDLPGMIPAVSFEDLWTQYPALLRMVNQSVTYSQITNGDVAPLGDCNAFDDVSTLVENPS